MLTSFLAYGARKGFLRPVLNYGRKIMDEYYTNEAVHRVVAEKIAPLNLKKSRSGSISLFLKSILAVFLVAILQNLILPENWLRTATGYA